MVGRVVFPRLLMSAKSLQTFLKDSESFYILFSNLDPKINFTDDIILWPTTQIIFNNWGDP